MGLRPPAALGVEGAGRVLAVGAGVGEFAGGVLGGLAWAAIGRVREDAALTSLAPEVKSDVAPETLSGATS